MTRALIALALLAPAAALAAERQYQFRSVEDPAAPPDPGVCASAPFTANLRFGGSLWTYRTRERDGAVRTDEETKIGTATACVRVNDFLFTAFGPQAQFFAQLNLPEGPVEANGWCTVISNNVPRGGIVLAGCNLAVVTAPAGFRGGAVASLSTFNVGRVPGFGTGSMWTVQLYDDGAPGNGREDSDHALEWIDDR